MAALGAPLSCCAAGAGAAARLTPARPVSGALALRAVRAPRRRCAAGPARRTLAVTASAAAWPAGAKLAGECAAWTHPYRLPCTFSARPRRLRWSAERCAPSRSSVLAQRAARSAPRLRFAKARRDTGRFALTLTQLPSPAAPSLPGVGSAVPKMVLTNADLSKLVETNDEWIAARTGPRPCQHLLPTPKYER